ncbi:MAG: hypothetical protein WC712_05275 [Candidatus Brocadiia bacterium]
MQRRVLLVLTVSLLAVILAWNEGSAEGKRPFEWESLGTNMFDKIDDKPLVVYLQSFDWHYQILCRENSLFSCPQMETLREKFHWAKAWPYFGWGSTAFKGMGHPALIIYEKKDAPSEQIALLTTGNKEVLGKLAEIAGVTLSGEIPVFDQNSYQRGMAYLTKISAAIERDDLTAAKEGLREYEQSMPDDVFLVHAQDAVGKLEKGKVQNERASTMRKCIEDVYIARDLPAFFSLLGEWDAETMFPILLWDDYYAPAFLARYKPKRVFFAPPSPKGATVSEALIWQALCASLDSTKTAENKTGSSSEYFARMKAAHPAPVGAVLADTKATGLAAASMLASGHFQLLLLDELATKNAATAIGEEDFNKLQDRVAALFDATGIPYKRLFDGLDYFTIACDLPEGAALLSRADKDPYALDDALFRNPDDSRWGFFGRLVGDDAEKLYQANCSLFLPVGSAYFFNTYSTEGSWGEYSTESASDQFTEKGISNENIMEDATLSHWNRQFATPNQNDLVYVNSSGGGSNWSIKAGGASTEDIPLSLPTVVNFTHSFSAANIYDNGTIAGRWLRHGAFVYFGSYREPLLSAFATPKDFAEETLEGFPLSFALRRKMGDPFCTPWKCVYVGDPLYFLTAQRTISPSRDVLEAKYSSSALFDTIMKRSLVKPDERLARDIEAMRLAAAMGDMAKFKSAESGAEKYIKGKKNPPLELISAISELTVTLGALRADSALVSTGMAFATAYCAPADECTYWVYQAQKGAMTALEMEYTTTKKGNNTTAKADFLRVFEPLARAALKDDVAKQVVTRLAALLKSAGLEAITKDLKDALLKAAKPDSPIAKAITGIQ